MPERNNPFIRITDSLTDRILCVGGAVGFSQMPEFIQQYAQRLGGHLEEARRQLAQFTQTAAQSGLTLPEYITRTSTTADSAVAKLGGVMSASVERVDALSTAMAAMRDASVWERPVVFIRDIDTEIASATWEAYKPAVPTTLEGAAYALFGMIMALAFYHLGIVPTLTRFFKKRASRKLVQS